MTSLAVTPGGQRAVELDAQRLAAPCTRTAPVTQAFAMSVVPTPNATQPSAPLCGVCESVPATSWPGSA